MPPLTIQEAQSKLPEVIHRLTAGEEVLITENNEVVARLISAGKAARRHRQLGTLQGTVLYVAPDFDAPLDDFKEYME